MLDYLEDTHAVTGTRRTDPPRSGQTASGYGARIPTSLELRIGARWHRVYVIQYANAGSAYIRKGGRRLFLREDWS
jgi:hypothetical protein